MSVDPNNPNDVFPRLPIGGDDYSLFNKFKQNVLPLRRAGAINDVGTRLQQPVMHQEMQQTRADFGDNSPLRPGYTPPNLGVVYKPPMTDQIGAQMLGIGPGAVTPLDERELALKGKAIESTAADKDIKNNIAQQKVDISSDRADVYKFKAENPGVKIVAPKGGNIIAINSATGQTVKDFGPAGTLSDDERIKLEQTGRMDLADKNNTARESLAELSARHAKERQDAELANKNAGSTTTTSVTDAAGKNLGTRTSSTKANAAPPKKGDKKTFPNGVEGIFDGIGWKPVPKGK